MAITESSASAVAVSASAANASASSAFDHLKPYFDVLAAAANLATLVASVIAIYVFVANRKKFSAALQLLLNFAFQSTLHELTEKLERLNDYNCNDEADRPEIRAILFEIAGQLRGNRRLASSLSALTAKVEAFAQGKRLSEPHKRSIVSELRENLRHHQVNSVEQESAP